MKHYVILNNYQIGSAELRCCAVDKIVSQERIDKCHTKVVFEDLTGNERRLIIKALCGGQTYKLRKEND